MNLKSIEYFLAVAEEMNITRTAEHLHISQQALSGHIRRLEEEYSVQLFDRRPSFRLTDAGKQLVFYGRQIMEAEAAIRSAFSDITVNAKATLNFGISRLRSSVFFPLIWGLFKPSHPNISIELVDGKSSYLDELLMDGKIDLYVGIDVPNSLNQHKTLLATENLHCCFTEGLIRECYPNDYAEVLKSFAGGADIMKITNMPVITLRQGNRLRESLDRFLAHRKKPYYILECDEQGLIYDTAKTGLGVGLLSPITLYQHRNDTLPDGEKLCTFPLLEDIDTNETYLVYRSDYNLPNYVNDFINSTERVFRNYAHSITKHYS
ncbi:MAG: LysR family transcriptional regulator [Synergistaceae bacterium]|nr:LysR family transcriptional regulator [Synergistaceae bacterium]